MSEAIQRAHAQGHKRYGASHNHAELQTQAMRRGKKQALQWVCQTILREKCENVVGFNESGSALGPGLKWHYARLRQGGVDWEGYAECGASPRRTFERQFAAMTFHDATADGQAKAGALFAAGRARR